MGRPQGFETAVVVRRAREVFWEHGYEEASLPALEEATGLARSSLYHAFGSKRGLFDAAVQSYLDEIIRPRLRPLLADDVDAGTIVEYFTGLRTALDRSGTLPGPQGCLLVNTASSPLARDEAVREVVAGYHEEVRAALRRGIAARWPGESAAEHDLRTTLCSSLAVSALALARVDRPRALETLDSALALLAGAHA